MLIISIATIVLFGLSLLWFNIFSWVFYFGLGYMSHLVSDSISYIYNTRNITAKEKYYTNFGLPKK